MEKNISLIVPKIEDLWFKKQIKEDPNTMDYNAGYDLTFNGYNRETGTIKTDIKAWIFRLLRANFKRISILHFRT